jgi:hypothetical protein
MRHGSIAMATARVDVTCRQKERRQAGVQLERLKLQERDALYLTYVLWSLEVPA